MFYAHFVLSKKGPLARIWLAAHWDKKLTRSQVFETNISSSVEAILEPKVKLALRTSGHLLLGVVRIHSRQAKYLLSDCNEAFVKIKMAFRPGADLADDSHRDNTALAAITLSDNIHDFESTLADINDMDPFGIAVNQSRPEDITMREEFGEPNLGRPDDDFGDSTFEDAVDRDFVGEALEEHNVDVEMTAITDELVQQDHHGHVIVHSPDSPSTTVASHHHHHVFPEMPSSVGLDNNDSEFGDAMDYGDEESVENIEQMFQDSQVANVSESVSGAESRLIDSTIDQNNTIVDVLELPTVVEEDASMILNDPCLDAGLVPKIDIPAPAQQPAQLQQIPLQLQPQPQPQQQQQPPPPQPPQARQLPDFVLPPVDRSLRENRRAPKRKRKLLIDEHKSIPSDVMKMQMQDTSEITTRLDLAPPTRKLMLWKETGNVEALFTTPGRAIPSRILQKLFYRNMKTVSVPNDAPDGLPVIPGVKRVGGFLNLDDDGADEQQHEQQQHQHELPPASSINNQNNNNNNNNRWNEATSLPAAAAAAAGISESTTTTGGGSLGAVHHRELSQISEEGAGSGNEMHVMMPEGACSSYSTSYDCWSAGHATPHRGGDDDEFDVGFHPLTPVPSSAVAVNPPHSITGSPRHHRQGSSEPDDSSSSRYMPPVVLPTNQLLSSALINKSSSINLPYSSALTNANGSTAAAATTTGLPDPLGPPLTMGMLHESTVAAYAADIDRIYYNNNNNAPSSTTSWYPGKSALDLTGTNVTHHQQQQQQLELSQLINKSASSSLGSAFTEMPSIERARDQRDSTLSSFGNFSDAVNESVLDRTINSGGVMEREQESATESLSNKLQTTMVMLDQQLDKVNEEYPVEITQEGLEKRSEIMLNVLRNAIKREGQVDFHHLTVSNNKKQAASKFYTLLLLGKQKKLQMFQATPDSNIIITSVLNE